jgi:hypothetical protein
VCGTFSSGVMSSSATSTGLGGADPGIIGPITAHTQPGVRHTATWVKQGREERGSSLRGGLTRFFFLRGEHDAAHTLRPVTHQTAPGWVISHIIQHGAL